jgi:hypothetical protein
VFRSREEEGTGTGTGSQVELSHFPHLFGDVFLGPFNNNINNNKKSSYPLHTLVSPPRQGRLLHLLYLLPEHKGSSVPLHQEKILFDAGEIFD